MQISTIKQPTRTKKAPKYTSIIPKDTDTEIAPKSTKYKYTEAFVSKELDSMLSDISAHEQIYTKAQLFADKEYSPKKFSQWRNKYATSKRIDEKLKRIENVLEARLVSKGLRDPRVTGFVIFLLKNHHGYTDKRELEQETTHVFKVSRGDVRSLPNRGKVIDIQPK